MQPEGRDGKNHHRGGDLRCPVPDVQVSHKGLVGIDGDGLRGSARAASGHHPDQIEDRKGLDDTKHQGDENEREQEWRSRNESFAQAPPTSISMAS